MDTTTFLIIIGIITFISAFTAIRATRRRKIDEGLEEEYRVQTLEVRNSNFDFDYKEMIDLGLNEWVPEGLKKKYQNALDKEYLLKAHMEFLEENPELENDSKRLWIEAHRFLFMAGIFKNVEMFSEEVDHIWHAMLHFEKDYETFSHNFIGRKIEHIPHGEKVHKPKERALFDILYILLFQVSSNNIKIWNGFLEKDRIDHVFEWFSYIKNTSTNTLEKEMLLPDTSAVAANLFLQLIRKVKDGIEFDGMEAKRVKTRANYIKEPEVSHKGQGMDFSMSILSQIQVRTFEDQWVKIEEDYEKQKAKEDYAYQQSLYSGSSLNDDRNSGSGKYSSGYDSDFSSTSSKSSSSSDSDSGSSSSCSSGGGSSSSCSSCSSCSS